MKRHVTLFFDGKPAENLSAICLRLFLINLKGHYISSSGVFFELYAINVSSYVFNFIVRHLNTLSSNFNCSLYAYD